MKRIVYSIIACLVFINGTFIYANNDPIFTKNVPIINQMPELPTGCEATALTMILKHSGYNITKEQVAKDMPKANPIWKNGKTYAAHPSEAFYGNPFSRAGYGVYSPVILKMINQYLEGRGGDLTGQSLTQVLEVVKEGQPVIVWATMGLKPAYLTASWITPSGVFRWKAGEHTLVIVGYDDQFIYTNDPLKGKQVSYDRSSFEKRYNEMGKMAVYIKPSYLEKTLTINEEPFSQPAILIEDKHLIPIRALSELIDAAIEIKEGKIILIHDLDQYEIDITSSSKLLDYDHFKIYFLNNITYIDLKILKEKTYMDINYTNTDIMIKNNTKTLTFDMLPIEVDR